MVNFYLTAAGIRRNNNFDLDPYYGGEIYPSVSLPQPFYYKLPANYGIVEIIYESGCPADLYIQINHNANERSKELFIKNLSPSQLTQFEERRSFTIKGSEGGRYELFTSSWHTNVLDLTYNCLSCLIIKSTYQCPFWDHILAQKLLIETKEYEFKGKAHPVHKIKSISIPTTEMPQIAKHKITIIESSIYGEHS